MKKICVLLIVTILLLSGCAENNSIGIIGGTDGPTAVFITSSINWMYISAIIAVVIIISAIIYIQRKKR